MQFSYSVQLYALPPYDDKRPVEKLIGTIQASNFDGALSQVVVRASKRREQLERERGGLFGYNSNEIKLQHVPDALPSVSESRRAVITPMQYQQCALRTLYPNLTTDQRLGLCGLGLPGEIGEVVDLIKKFLYHRNGKPLNREKLKDELGDVLWYIAVLLDTLGLTFEDVMAANVAKNEKRHPNGFNPHYSSDSHASETES